MFNAKAFLTVKEVNLYIKNLLDGDSLLSNIWVKGEISNFKAHSSGHFYFTLKDASGTLKCVMFKSRAQRIKFMPTHGMEVLAQGYISVFERDGQYQLYVEDMLPSGAGALNIAYEQLKEKLAQEGLFASERKRKLPSFPQSIGIVTSPTGAALKDMLTIIKRRSPHVKIIISPAQVQGAEGADSICTALEKIYKLPIDVIIVGRGGGSLEELWCFNEEAVVRKIASSPVPIVSAVGHETDFTLSDFAADIRAATPSMAAELVTPLETELNLKLVTMQNRLVNALRKILAQERQRVSYLANRQVIRDPQRIFTKYQQELDQLSSRLINGYHQNIKEKKANLVLLANKLDALSPLKTINRVYSLSYSIKGELIKNIEQVEIGDIIQVFISNGQLTCLVQEKEEISHEKAFKL
ncbi:MAG: exodeoxyribonuclease VII large subunit [Clostridia bacterium]|nr:exodeoxyribonuclease VII large subunit [Clostridia bacterium]